MATFLHAVQAYAPKLVLNKSIQMNKIANYISTRTGLNRSEVAMVLEELHATILFFNSQGTPVKLPNIGTFAPSISRDGNLRINLRVDPSLKKGLNAPGFYDGQIRNRANIGLENEGYKALWDQEHPDDPLEI